MLSQSHYRCIDACQEAIATSEACLALVDPTLANDANAQHRADLCRSSIRLCKVAVEELNLHSAFSIQICALCAVICRACAEECEASQSGQAWRDCAAACHRAAAECHAIATATTSRRATPEPV